jgi:hypothetical protein
MAPFDAVYAQNPPSILSYLIDVSKVQEVDITLTIRAVILHNIKENLVMAQNCMKKQVDQCCLECQIAKGDHVFLHLQPYKKTSLKEDHCQKLDPKFYGPYKILKCVGTMDYKLSLPNNSKIHPIFIFIA